jgi:hypothetical protein
MATVAELALSATYREAQRTLSAWLERGQREARRSAFATRAALAGLDAAERHRLARWLAWLCMAAGRKGSALQTRIRYLDGVLGEATSAALAQLPGNHAAAHTHPALDWSTPTRLGA